MKLKLTVFLAAGVIAMGLLLGASAAQAATVILEGDNVIRIEDLDVGGTFYNVDFVDGSASEVYGEEPEFDFPAVPPALPTDASSAVDAVNDALNNNSTIPLGAGPQGSELFHIGYNKIVATTYAAVGRYSGGAWRDALTIMFGDSFTWARFTETTAPEQFTIGGNVTGLVGNGLVLQNNGGDDETITGNGAFTFDTPLAAGSPYNVTVFTQPDGQTCSVTNGSGTVTDQAVTNVAVTCAPPVDPPVADTGFLPGAVYLPLLLGGDVVPPEQVAVPNVVGLDQLSAEGAIVAAGLILGTVSDQSSESVADGDVISQDPTAGTEVNLGSAVNLVVSTGPGGGGGEEVLFESPVAGKATRILELEIDGKLYNVAWRESTSAAAVYGPDFPGVFPFTTADAAYAAIDAVNAALTAAGATQIGADTALNTPLFNEEFYLAWESSDNGGLPDTITYRAGSIKTGTWDRYDPPGDDQLLWNTGDERTYTTFFGGGE